MNADGARVARACLMSAAEPGDVEVARLVLEHGPVMAAELSAAITGDVWMRAAEELAQAQSTGLQLVTPEDEQWPARLSVPLPASSRTDRTAPPLGLWVYGEGRLHELLSRVVIITGTPRATPYGVSVAFDLSRDLSGVGWTVLGYGRAGIASAVLRGAREASGLVVVLPPGPVIGWRSRELLMPPGHGLRFGERIVQRDHPVYADIVRDAQLAVAVAAAVVLVEPDSRGIDRETIRFCLSTGRQMLAVPGSISYRGSSFAHDLIRSGRARLITGAHDVLIDLAGPQRSCG